MLKAFNTFSSTIRLGAACAGAALLLGACGGSAGLGDGPQRLNENLPSNVTAAATSVHGADVDHAGEQPGAMGAPVAAEAPVAAVSPAAPAYGAEAASADAVVYPPSEEGNVSAPADAASAAAGQQAPSPAEPAQRPPTV